MTDGAIPASSRRFGNRSWAYLEILAKVIGPTCRPVATATRGSSAVRVRWHLDRIQGRRRRQIETHSSTSIDKVPSGERWLHEIKFNGYRVQVHLRDTAVEGSTGAAMTGHRWCLAGCPHGSNPTNTVVAAL